MKTRISQIAAVTFFALFILVGNVYANEKVKNNTNLVNLEEELVLENWMTNNDFWYTEKIYSIETANEESMELEDWMINSKVWNTKITENTETSLELENWMVNENIWHKGESISNESVAEESLELENWMTNDKVWKMNKKVFTNLEIETEETLIIEDWMTNKNIWNK